MEKDDTIEHLKEEVIDLRITVKNLEGMVKIL
jgi:hypothetical protein